MDKTQSKSSHRENVDSVIFESNKQVDAYKLERYKYILREIHFLNESTHKYLTLFQTLTAAIVGGGIGIFVIWKSLKIDASTARLAIQGSLGLLILVALFVNVSILVNVLSWLDYRREEVDLLNQSIEQNWRRLPQLRNFWRWSETYILLFVSLAVIGIVFYVEYQIIPLVK